MKQRGKGREQFIIQYLLRKNASIPLNYLNSECRDLHYYHIKLKLIIRPLKNERTNY